MTVTKWDLTKDMLGVIFFFALMVASISFFSWHVPNIYFQFLIYLFSVVGTVICCIVAVGYYAIFKSDWKEYKFVQNYR